VLINVHFNTHAR